MMMNRRNFLRAAGVSLSLPALDFFAPRGLAGTAGAPRRMVMINASMGLLPKEFFPQEVGSNYQLSPYLEMFSPLRDRFSVFSGLSHPSVDGGHHAEISFLTGAPHPGASGFRNTISLDQYAAERVGTQARVPSLVLHAGPGARKKGLSWTSSGVSIPAEDKPSELYKRLFLTGSQSEIDARVEELRVGRSILDVVGDRAKSLGRKLGREDREKVDEYFTSVRELEQRLVTAEEWEKTPKPRVDAPMPKDIEDKTDIVNMSRAMYEMIKLALQTDSTRIVSLRVHSYASVKIDGVEQGHHSLTHHGGRPEAIEQLKRIEIARLQEFRDFLVALSETPDGESNLLDQTAVLYGTHMGDANIHSNDNLPVMLAGGSFRHGQHLEFDRNHNAPLANVYVSMLQEMGIESDQFASSTGTLTGLERSRA